MKVKFLRTELYENEGRNKGHLFKKDEEYDLPDDHANRWIRRGAAERMDPEEDAFKALNKVSDKPAEGNVARSDPKPASEVSARPSAVDRSTHAAPASRAPDADKAEAEKRDPPKR